MEKNSREKWQERIDNMSHGELWHMIAHEKETCYKEFYDMGRDRLREELRMLEERYGVAKEEMKASRKRFEAKTETPPSDLGTLDLLKWVLNQLGCRYEAGEVEDSINFYYQGMSYYALVDEDSVSVVYDNWYEIDMEDEDHVERIKKAVNEMNYCFAESTYYFINENTNRIAVSSQSEFLFISQIPNLLKYFMNKMGGLLFCRSRFYLEIDYLESWD